MLMRFQGGLLAAASIGVHRRELLEAVVVFGEATARPVKRSWYRNRGTSEARADVKAGRFLLKTYGLPMYTPCDAAEIRAAEQLYGVRHDVVAGCVVSEQLVHHAAGYNSVVEAALAKRFGRDWREKARLVASADPECQDSSSPSERAQPTPSSSRP